MNPQNKIHFCCPFWGQSHLTAQIFLDKVESENYDGIEIDLSEPGTFLTELLEGIARIRKKKHFVFIAQNVLPPEKENAAEHSARLKKRMQFLVSLEPDFINSHTGKDHFSFDDNCRLIEMAMQLSESSGIRILHETHRGRFSFHAFTLLRYLEKFPQLELVGDFSHFCTVSESMLDDQQEIIEKIIPHVSHIHARVGHEQAPQVNDPFAPEWKNHMNIFMEWWKQIIASRRQLNLPVTVTPEFGPAPYMPSLPYSQLPTADQWMVNLKMKDMFMKLESES